MGRRLAWAGGGGPVDPVDDLIEGPEPAPNHRHLIDHPQSVEQQRFELDARAEDRIEFDPPGLEKELPLLPLEGVNHALAELKMEDVREILTGDHIEPHQHIAQHLQSALLDLEGAAEVFLADHPDAYQHGTQGLGRVQRPDDHPLGEHQLGQAIAVLQYQLPGLAVLADDLEDADHTQLLDLAPKRHRFSPHALLLPRPPGPFASPGARGARRPPSPSHRVQPPPRRTGHS